MMTSFWLAEQTGWQRTLGSMTVSLACLLGSQAMAAEATLAPPATVQAADRGDDWWRQRHERFNKQAATEQWQLVFLGDSITEAWDGPGKEVWEKYYGNRHAGNLGISGDETQHVLYRIQHGNLAGQTPKLAVIMIGTNNLGNAHHSPDDIIAGVTALVEQLRELTPDTQILLLGVFPRGERPDDPFRGQIREINRGLGELDEDEMVYFLDIGDKFLEPDGTISKKVMPDFLHLSPVGYERWAAAIEPAVKDLMGDKSPK